MNRICLALVCLWITSNALAQSGNSGPQDVSPYGPAINVAVLNIDETEGDSFFADAERNERRGELNEALTLFGKAAFEYNSDKKLMQYAGSLLRMGNVHLLLSHYTEAEQVVLNVALKTYARLGSKAGQMASYNQLGKIYFGANKLTQSLWFYTQQGILAQQLKNNAAYIESIMGIATVKIKKKEYQLALKDIGRAETLAKYYNYSQFNSQIRATKATISEKQASKK
jgi:tetratricopeptide (TPR) repeat protein